MAEELSIVISADVEDAKQGIKSVSSVLDDFARKGQLSINVLEQSMLDLKKAIRSSSDPSEVAKLKEAYEALRLKLNSFKNESGLATQLGGISRATRTAHADLDQISQSLKGFASGSERGVDALSNIVFTFERLAGQTGGVKAAISALGETLIGPAGLVLAFTTLLPLLESLVEDLFNFGDAFDDAAIAAANFKNDLKSVDDFIKGFKENLDFQAEINKLKAQLQLGSGFKANIFGQVLDIENAKKQLGLLDRALEDTFNEINSRLASASIVLGKSGKKLFDSFNQTIELIPKDLIDKLGDSDKRFLTELKDLSEQAADINKERGRLMDGIEKGNLKKQITEHDKQLEEDKKHNEERLREQNEFIQKTIALGKKLQSQFSDNLKAQVKIFDEDDLKTQLAKSQVLIDNFINHNFRNVIERFTIIPDIKLPKLKPEIEKPFFEAEFKDFVKDITVPIKIVLDVATIPEVERSIEQIFSDFSQKTIFGDVGRKTGEQFRDALLKSVQELRKGFVINPEIPTDALIEDIQKKLSIIKEAARNLITTEDFNAAIKTLEQLGIAGKEAAEATRDAFIKAGRSSEDAAKAAEAVQELFGGISEGTATAAGLINDTLTPAFTGLFDAIISGKDPLKAFFNGLITSIDQVIQKLIQAAIQSLILKSIASSLTGPGAIFNLLGLTGFGFLAEGGPAQKGKPYIVGEKGYELFIPNENGTVISHDKLIKAQSVKDNEITKENFSEIRMKQFESRILESINKSFISIHSSISNFHNSIVKSFERIFISSLKISTEKITNNNQFFSIERFQKQFNIPAFAQGGAVFGPTLAILGEGFGVSRSNPELVGTANQLKGIMGGEFGLNLSLSLESRHNGNDLVYFINKAMKTNIRTTGRTGL